MEISLVISVVSVVIAVSNFVLSRKDKSNNEVKEEQKQYSKHDLINHRLNELDKKVDKILDKLDVQDKETDEKIEKALKQHISIYHKKVKKEV